MLSVQWSYTVYNSKSESWISEKAVENENAGIYFEIYSGLHFSIPDNMNTCFFFVFFFCSTSFNNPILQNQNSIQWFANLINLYFYVQQDIKNISDVDKKTFYHLMEHISPFWFMAATHLKKVETEVTKDWKSYWRKSKTNGRAFDS